MTDDLLKEIALAGPEHLDATYVSGYDRKARLDPTEDLDALQARGLGPESTLIDFGAGTGTFAIAAALVCKRVVAVDVSPAMMAAICAKVAAHGAQNVEPVQAGLSYGTRLLRRTSSTRGTHCITSPTSGRRSRSTVWRRYSPLAAP